MNSDVERRIAQASKAFGTLCQERINKFPCPQESTNRTQEAKLDQFSLVGIGTGWYKVCNTYCPNGPFLPSETGYMIN